MAERKYADEASAREFAVVVVMRLSLYAASSRFEIAAPLLREKSPRKTRRTSFVESAASFRDTISLSRRPKRKFKMDSLAAKVVLGMAVFVFSVQSPAWLKAQDKPDSSPSPALGQSAGAPPGKATGD